MARFHGVRVAGCCVIAFRLKIPLGGEEIMGLSWQQGPLSPGAIGRFLVPEPLPKRLLYVEPLRRRMRVRFGGNWIADSENVLLLFEPGRYPMAYFPETDVVSKHSTTHRAYDPPSRSWAHILVYRPGGRAERTARGMATHRPARLRERVAGTGCIRLAGHGGFLRRRRTDRGPCRRQLSPHRHPPDIPSSHGPPS